MYVCLWRAAYVGVRFRREPNENEKECKVRFAWRVKTLGIVPLSLLMAAVMLLATACTFVVAPIAVAKDAEVVTAPEGATQMWVDVEYAGDGQIEGTLNGDQIGFTASPSGATAICDVVAGTAYRLSLAASAQIDALVALTFANDNDVIIQESSVQAHLAQNETTVVPQNPSKPGSGSGNVSHSSDDVATKSTSAVGETGSQIAIVAVVAVMLCIVGALVAVARHRRAGRVAYELESENAQEANR